MTDTGTDTFFATPSELEVAQTNAQLITRSDNPGLPLLVVLVAERIREKVTLSVCRKALVARSANLKPEDLTTRFDPKDNGARLLFEAANRITNDSVISDLLPPMLNPGQIIHIDPRNRI